MGLIELKAVEIHHFIPYRNEVVYEFVLSIRLGINLSNRPEL
jgi:hypothetical protein